MPIAVTQVVAAVHAAQVVVSLYVSVHHWVGRENSFKKFYFDI